MSQKCVIQVTKKFKRYNLQNDFGIDIFIDNDYSLESLEAIKLYINGQYVLQCGYKATVHPRSSTAIKGLLIHTTVIDAEFTGRLFVVGTNINREKVILKKGSRVAQLVVSPVTVSEFQLVEA